MSKTAREVIGWHFKGICDEYGKPEGEEYSWADEVVADLEREGFVIVPKDDHVLAVIKERRWTGEKLEALADRINKHATAKGGVSNLSVLERHLLCTLLRSIAASQEPKP